MFAAALLLASTVSQFDYCAKFDSGYALPPNAEKVVAANQCDPQSGMCNVKLAEKFANGDGIARDLDTAEYYLCQSGLAEEEFQGMLGHLQKLRDGETDEPLRYCAFSDFGYGWRYCVNERWNEEMPLLDARIETQRNAAKSKSIDTLILRAKTFLDADSLRYSTTFTGGIGQMPLTQLFELEQKKQFVESLEQFSRQRATSASSDDEKAVDAVLNDAYRAEMKEVEAFKELKEWPAQTRDAQRKWIAYRDAFVAYYIERWRDAASNDVLRREIVTELSNQRADALGR
ncbi:MAG: lysozyme inhibitor LprI family protein [Thermoanaerobaculia bacterium]